MTEEKAADSKWLSAFEDLYAGVYSFSWCIGTADLSGDGDHKLVIADLGTGAYSMKLKIYKGTSVMSEHVLIDLPTAVVPFFMENTEPKSPAVAVASGQSIFVYKNLKPYYKFTLPTEPVVQAELDIWDRARMEGDTRSLNEALINLKQEIPDKMLTTRSQRYLLLPDHDRDPFLDLYINEPLKKTTVITTLTSMKRANAEPDAIDCLVLGTENGKIYVIDAEAFTVMSRATVPATPSFIVAAGLYDVDYRLVICCRDACVYTLKREMLEPSKASFCMAAHAVGMCRVGKAITVACDDHTLRAYTFKGKRQWSIEMPAKINTIEVLDYSSKNFQAVIVALENREIRVYKDSFLVDQFSTDSVITCLKFGCLGREEGALIMINRGGGLQVKLLKRTAKFDEKIGPIGPASIHAPKLNIPKKTKAFVDQTIRERENAISMHQTFQKDLFLLRLTTARAYAESQKQKINPVAVNSEGDMIKLSAEIQGFGPTFILKITLQATSKKPPMDMFLVFQYNDKLYDVEQSYVPVPFLVPGISYPYDVTITCKSEMGVSEDVKVLLMKSGNSVPVMTALITMPVSEAPLTD